MLKRIKGYMAHRGPEDALPESAELESNGFVVLRNVFSPDEVSALAEEINGVFEDYERDNRAGKFRPADEDDMFRYEMLNRSRLSQDAVANEKILSVIEPLLGEDCHVIANTAWRNEAHHEGTHGGQGWHIDAGPHVPLPEGVEWPAEIPHPVFAIGVHIYLKDCNLDDGPTGVLKGSHLSGRFPPREKAGDDNLEYNGQSVQPLITQAGDVGLFVSDIWHRRMPAGKTDSGRFFLQVHYGRRDIAQRLKPTSTLNQLSREAIDHATQPRQKTVIGLHPSLFYDG
jgi:ectoine hydroxylase-related dioxygenase (phytanoyl-CoA dioxygenase family)